MYTIYNIEMSSSIYEMSLIDILLNDTFWQLCERFITKEYWQKHF